MAITNVLRNADYNAVEWNDQVKDAQGNVLVVGTPLNEDNLNNQERGILTAHYDIGLLAYLAMQFARLSGTELDKIKNQRILQGQATISNSSGSGTGYFRTSDPFVSVPIPATAYPQINAPNYDVLVTPINGDGSEGKLVVSGKTQNGFVVSMTGSALSVSFMWTLFNPNV